MHPVAHFTFGALLAGCVVVFGVELPSRRRSSGRSSMSRWEILLLMLVMGALAAAPQSTRFFGDRKLDTGFIFNFFLFHDVLNLVGQRYRLGDGLLDPPVTVFSLLLGLVVLLIIYLRSETSPGWNALWRDVIYFSVIIVCLVGVRLAVSRSSYRYMPQVWVHIGGQAYVVVGNTVFTPHWSPVAGKVRDKAIAVRDTYYAVNSTRWAGGQPDSVKLFLAGNMDPRSFVYPLEYGVMVSMLSALMQVPGLATEEEIAKIVQAGTLPKRDMPLAAIVGIPLIALATCAALVCPAIRSHSCPIASHL